MTQSRQPLIVGINGGATHTTLALVDGDLNILARVEIGPTNFHNVGLETTRDRLQQGIEELTRRVNVARTQIDGIGAALSGLDRPVERTMFTQIFEAIVPGKPVVLDNDGVAALVAGAGRRFGVVTISGTGSICVGFNEQGKRARSGGWGYHIDTGSGYAIGRETLGLIARSVDGTAPPTALVERVQKRLGMTLPDEIIAWIYAPERRIEEIATIAVETVALAETDVVATGIILRAADALAADARNVAAQLGLGGEPFPLVMSGSVFVHCPLLRDLFTSAVQTTLPHAAPILADRDADVGAALMAFEHLGIVPTGTQPVLPVRTHPLSRATEQRNRLTMNISQRSSSDLVALMNLEDQRVPRSVAAALPQIAVLINAVAERFLKGGRIFYVGAGTSGRLAVLDSAECRPTFGTMPDQVVGILAGGAVAMFQSVEGAEDDEAQGRAEIAARNVGSLDCVIGVAASGSTPFVSGALLEALERDALTGGVVNVVDAPILELAQHPVIVPTGPEVITGSTRLKAGTAQKMVLNMISTGVMVRAGRTFGNLMTDMQASNLKLHHRAKVIVAEATGFSIEEAATLLDQCNHEIKTAIAAALLHTTPEIARQRLAEVNGNVNRIANE